MSVCILTSAEVSYHRSTGTVSTPFLTTYPPSCLHCIGHQLRPHHPKNNQRNPNELEWISGDTGLVSNWTNSVTGDLVYHQIQLATHVPYSEIRDMSQDGSAFYGMEKVSRYFRVSFVWAWVIGGGSHWSLVDWLFFLSGMGWHTWLEETQHCGVLSTGLEGSRMRSIRILGPSVGMFLSIFLCFWQKLFLINGNFKQ